MNNTVSLIDALVYSEHVTFYTYVAAASVLICDYFTMLHQEIELIWFSKWSYTKVSFLVIRYTAFVGVIFVFYYEMANAEPEVCKVIIPMAIFLLASITCLAEAIFAIRTWAVWQRHRAVGIVLGILTVVNAVSQFVVLLMFTRSLRYGELEPNLYPVIAGCDVTMSPTSNTIVIYPLVFCVVEAVVLTLMVISAVQSYRRGNKSKLSMVIHRDAILFYVLTLGIPLLFLLPIRRLFLWTPMALALYSTLAVRMILNMRRVGTRGMETELHDESPVLSTQILFAPIDSSQEHTAGTQTSGDLEGPNRSNDMTTP